LSCSSPSVRNASYRLYRHNTYLFKEMKDSFKESPERLEKDLSKTKVLIHRFILSTLGHRVIDACGDDVKLPVEAIVDDAGTARFEIEAGRPRFQSWEDVTEKGLQEAGCIDTIFS